MLNLRIITLSMKQGPLVTSMKSNLELIQLYLK